MKTGLVALASLLLVACSKDDSKPVVSQDPPWNVAGDVTHVRLQDSTDIFKDDANRRESAKGTRLLWTVNVGGCSGSMLTTSLMLTANHCSPRAGSTYTSGACIAAGCSGDLRAVRVLERHASFDYAIVQVTWTREETKWAQRYSPSILTDQNDLKMGKENDVPKIFTVGFPGDRREATYAFGFPKAYQGNKMVYSISSINGNSGGAVWREEDNKLVGMTNFGPHQLGDPNGRNRDFEDRTAWNGGPNMAMMYAQSTILKEVFSFEGTNPRVSYEGRLLFDDSQAQ